MKSIRINNDSNTLNVYNYSLQGACVIQFIRTDFQTIKDFFNDKVISFLEILDENNYLVESTSIRMKGFYASIENTTIFEPVEKIIQEESNEYNESLGLNIPIEKVVQIIDEPHIVEMITVSLQTISVEGELEILKQQISPTINIATCTLDELKIFHLKKIGKDCTKIIETGITLNDKHYSLTEKDQINIKSLYDSCKMGLVTEVLYHADGELCSQYTANQMIELGETALQFVTYQITWCNHLNSWIKRCANKDEVLSIEYNSTLPEDLQNHFFSLVGGTTTS